MADNQGTAPISVLSRALTGNVFVEKKLAYINQGDKGNYNCFKHDVRNVLRSATADPSSGITATNKKKTHHRVLQIVETFEPWLPSDYHQFWRSYQPEGPLQWEGLPVKVRTDLETLFVGSAAEDAENLLTNGGQGITGLIPQLKNPALTSLDGGVATPTQIVENTHIGFRVHGGSTVPAVALTSDNIFKKFELMIQNQTNVMLRRKGMKFMVSPRTLQIFREAQRLELAFKGVNVTEAGAAVYGGYELVVNDSFPDDTILFASMTGSMQTDAIQMGTSMSSDYNNTHTGRINEFSRQWGTSLTFALDIFLVRPEEVGFYTKDTIS